MREVSEARERRADRLKERIYLTFTALAVVLALGGHTSATAEQALTTLAITVAGTLLAVLVADLVSHLVAHERLPTLDELRHALASSVGTVGAVLLPFVFLGLATLGVWDTGRALRGSAVALIVSLVAVGYAAVRRVRLPIWQRLVVLGAEAVLGLGVIGLELLAHR